MPESNSSHDIGTPSGLNFTSHADPKNLITQLPTIHERESEVDIKKLGVEILQAPKNSSSSEE